MKFGAARFRETGLCPDHGLIMLLCVCVHKQHVIVVTVPLKSHTRQVTLQPVCPSPASCLPNRAAHGPGCGCSVCRRPAQDGPRLQPACVGT